MQMTKIKPKWKCLRDTDQMRIANESTHIAIVDASPQRTEMFVRAERSSILPLSLYFSRTRLEYENGL